ncbi:hypothetical protein SAMN05880566_13328 [Janthinobacterium sp. TND4EL3]|uniref:hypothetical protein n=1 Tax=Janthinobacterium sp. TND4EL3 TaxID=1907311 RepID=UPI000956F990|nr:hypothetical protein [Janthinobacterium sp. TND4EL3]SIR88257.1 hypothetical protein SAMN05880566_13328 [Janthinobacterium sp. TND4EL3]
MKMKLLTTTLLTVCMSTAIADTYVVETVNGTSSDYPKLAAAHDASKCVYADKVVKLGDTLVVDQDVVLVCTSASHGAVFYPLAQDGMKRVLAEIPAQSK